MEILSNDAIYDLLLKYSTPLNEVRDILLDQKHIFGSYLLYSLSGRWQKWMDKYYKEYGNEIFGNKHEIEKMYFNNDDLVVAPLKGLTKREVNYYPVYFRLNLDQHTKQHDSISYKVKYSYDNFK